MRRLFQCFKNGLMGWRNCLSFVFDKSPKLEAGEMYKGEGIYPTNYYPGQIIKIEHPPVNYED